MTKPLNHRTWQTKADKEAAEQEADILRAGNLLVFDRLQHALGDSLAELNAANRKIEGKDLHIRELEAGLERAQNDHMAQASNAIAFQRQYAYTLRRLEGVLDLIAPDPGEVTRLTKSQEG